MKLQKVILDADFCIKIGRSSKYRFLEKLLPNLADEIFLHETVYNEIKYPPSAKEQINLLKNKGIIKIVNTNDLSEREEILYTGTHEKLYNVMGNPDNPTKNQGEICSLAMAKTKSIPYFATDEKKLQPIIDRVLNNGIDDVTCIRIQSVIERIRNGEIDDFGRREAKALWRLTGKDATVFDNEIWPSNET